MRLVPDSGSLREANDCHAPAGSPEGGQFCDADGVPSGSSPLAVGDRVEWQDVASTPELQKTASWRNVGEVVQVLKFAKMLKVRLADGFVVPVRMKLVRKATDTAKDETAKPYVSPHRKTKRRGPKTPPSPGTVEGVKYQQRAENARRSAEKRRIVNKIRQRD